MADVLLTTLSSDSFDSNISNNVFHMKGGATLNIGKLGQTLIKVAGLFYFVYLVSECIYRIITYFRSRFELMDNVEDRNPSEKYPLILYSQPNFLGEIKRVPVNQFERFSEKYGESHNLSYKSLKTFDDYIIEFRSVNMADNKANDVRMAEVEYIGEIDNIENFMRDNKDIGDQYGIKFSDKEEELAFEIRVIA